MHEPALPATYEFSVRVPAEAGFPVLEALEQTIPPPAAVGLSERDDGGWRVWAQFEMPPDRAALLGLVTSAAGADVATAARVRRLAEHDWVARARTALPPVRAGRFVVHGRHDRARVGARAGAVEIEAGQAFGTAHHDSTRGCLLALDRLIKRRRFARILDLGTGSGVLAIAAARAGRARVLASDIDPLAAGIARANARLNAVAGRVTAVPAEGIRHAAIRRSGPFDLVLANILARPLAELAPALARAVRQGSHVVLSGLLRGQAAPVAAAYGAAGFDLEAKINLGGWATLVMRRRRLARKHKPPRGRGFVTGQGDASRRRSAG